MVKRPPTPPSPDDSQFFTVVNPYPDQPYETFQDSKRFARWIACIVGGDNILAFYHKPKSPNVVIVEVAKESIDLRCLLGEHRWYEFLKEPGKEGMHAVSSVFPCTMSTAWDLEKIRWLRRDIESSWFTKWAPDQDGDIVYPYPMPHYCRPPSGDVTRVPLCRPIRQDIFHEQSSILNERDALRCPASERSFHCSTPTMISESSDKSSEAIPPTPGPLAAVLTPQFIPAIHGSDVPKGDAVIIEVADAQIAEKSAWEGYGEETKSPSEESLCVAHGVLCRSGICKLCSAKKHADKREERFRLLQEERSTRARVRRNGRSSTDDEGSQSRRAPRRTSAWTSGRPHPRLREDIPAVTTKGKPIHGIPSSAGRALPAHLRRGAEKSISETSTQSAPSIRSSLGSDASSCTSSVASLSSYIPRTTRSDECSDADSDVSSRSDVSKPLPWTASKPLNWQPYAKVRSDDELSVATGATSDAFHNPWKRVKAASITPLKWAELVDELYGEYPVTEDAGKDHGDAASVVSELDEEPF